MKKIFLLLITIIFSSYLLTGCFNMEEIKIQNYAKKQAKIYLENKYGEEFKYKKAYHEGTEFNAVASTYTIVFDKATVEYSTLSEEFKDDYQAKDINEDLMKYMEGVFPEYGIKFDEKDVEFSDIYATYYNGDISEFIEESKKHSKRTDHWIYCDISTHLKKTYCICEDNEDIQKLGYKIKSEILDKTSRIIIDEIVFVNKECYDNSIKNDTYPTINLVSCLVSKDNNNYIDQNQYSLVTRQVEDGDRYFFVGSAKLEWVGKN